MELIRKLIAVDKKSDKAVYLQISAAFIHHIMQGRLRKGLKLPGSRELAAILHINRMTVVAAYDELEAQGWIEMKPRKGAYIKTELPLLLPKKITELSEAFSMPATPFFLYNEKGIMVNPPTDFPMTGVLQINDGFPDPRLAPVSDLIRAMRSFSKKTSNRKYLMYGGNAGTDLLRAMLAKELNDTRGLPVCKENLLVTRGAQMGIYLAASLIIGPNDNIIVAAPGYTGINLTFKQLGATLQYVPVDEDGMDMDAVEKLCQKMKIKIVYVMPHHHNPTTVSLSPERRMRLLELARRYKFALLEDDYDYDFHYASKPILPMASLDRHGSVIYIGTLTKTLAPSIRIGFVCGPESFIKQATSLRKSIDVQGDSLLENAIAEMYKDGTITRHIKKSVKLYKERRDHFCQLLATELGNRVSYKKPDGGMSVWVKFLKDDLKMVAKKAFEKGLIIRDGTEYDTDKVKYNAVRMGFASLSLAEQERAVRILKQCTGA